MKNKKNRGKGLSFGRVAKLGIASVKAKPIRFAITIILFFVCLSIIGWSFSAVYVDVPSAALRAYRTYEEDEVGLSRRLNQDSMLASKENVNDNFNETDVKQIEDAFPSYRFDKLYELQFGTYGFKSVNTIKYYDNDRLERCVVADEDFLNRYGYSLLYGRLPKDETEIAIPQYFFELYCHYGYQDSLSGRRIQIDGYDSISEIKIQLKDSNNYGREISVVGVVDTKFESEQFEFLKTKEALVSENEWKDYRALKDRFDLSVRAGARNAAFVHPDFVRRYVNGFGVETRVLDATEILYYAFRGNAVPYSDAQGKNLIRIIDSEKEGLNQDETFAPLSFLEARSYPEMTKEEVVEAIRAGMTLKMQLASNQVKPYNVVGFYEDKVNDVFIVSDSEYAGAFVEKPHQTVSALLTQLSDDRGENEKLLALGSSSYDRNFDYVLDGCAGEAALTMKSAQRQANESLPWICSVAIVFSALMMFNFISATIAAKKKEIGILRAIGAKNGAVYGIFASESMFTAIVSFLASIFGSITLDFLFNRSMRFVAGYVWFLTYGIAEIATVLVVGSGIALIGSLIPILRLIRKKPMEILR